MNKKLFYIVFVIAVAVVFAILGWSYYVKNQPAPVPEIEEPAELGSDTTEAIDKALRNIDIKDINGELSDIDEQLGNL